MPRDSEDWVHQLYVQHAPDLYRVAKYRLQDPELAYDLTQEVFLTLLDHPNRVKDTNPGGWLRKTLQHKISHALSHRERSRPPGRRGRGLGLAPCPGPNGPPGGPPPPAAVGPDKALLTMAYEEGAPPGDGPAAGDPGHLRHLALPGQAAVQTLSHLTGRRVSP